MCLERPPILLAEGPTFQCSWTSHKSLFVMERSYFYDLWGQSSSRDSTVFVRSQLHLCDASIQAGPIVKWLFQPWHTCLFDSFVSYLSQTFKFLCDAYIRCICSGYFRLGNPIPVDTVCITLEDYCSDFVHVRGKFYTDLVQKGMLRVATEYIKAVFMRSAYLSVCTCI